MHRVEIQLMLCMTLEVHSNLMLAEGFYTPPTCSYYVTSRDWITYMYVTWQGTSIVVPAMATRPHAQMVFRCASSIFAYDGKLSYQHAFIINELFKCELSPFVNERTYAF